MSSFVGLNTALSGLMAQRRAMEVAAQNIANANTEGYTRQRTDLASVGGNSVPAIHSTWQGAGGGVTVTGQTRIRDAFLEGRAQVESGVHAQLEGSDAVLSSIELAIGEPSAEGLQAQLAKLWSGFEDVANKPEDLAVRSQLLQRAKGVVDVFHDIDRALTAQSGAYSERVDVLAAEVNTASASVARLNGAIKQGSMAGLPVNELMDKRDVLVVKLATLVGATSQPAPDGVVNVFIGTDALVDGRTTQAIEVTRDAVGITGLNWASSLPIDLTSGTARGLIDGVTSGGVIETQRSSLDALARQLASDVNAVQTTGYDLIEPPTAAAALFAAEFGGSITAANLTLAITDPKGIAASSLPPDANGPVYDDANARALAAVGTGPASPDTTYRQLVVNLGVQAQAASRRLDVQTSSLAQINAARESQSGVSTDEEMTQLLSYQRAYEAAARVMTTVDGALDTLINRTGLVGR
jgi:flagellar hook-associated protein 1 FlgK